MEKQVHLGDSAINVEKQYMSLIPQIKKDITNTLLHVNIEKKILQIMQETNIKNENKHKLMEAVFNQIDDLMKKMNMSLLYVRQPKLSLSAFNQMTINEMLSNLLTSKESINPFSTGWNCHYWNVFYYKLLSNFIQKNNFVIQLCLLRDNHAFLIVTYWSQSYIIDPTWRKKILWYLELISNKKSHFIHSISSEQVKNIPIVKTIKNVETSITKIESSETISVWITLNKINYQFIIDHKQYTWNIDIVFLKTWEIKQKIQLTPWTLEVKGLELNQKLKAITQNMELKDEDLIIIEKMINKSSPLILNKVFNYISIGYNE